MNSDSIKGFSLGLIAGALIAASVALLYAPQEGQKTRQLIKDKATEVRDRAGKFVKRKK